MEGKIKVGWLLNLTWSAIFLTLYYCISVVLWQGRRYNNDYDDDDDDDDDEEDDKDNNQ